MTARSPSDIFSYLSVFVMMLLVAVIVIIGTYNMQRIQNTGEIIVQNRIEKITLVESMKSAARERTIILQRMLLVDDPFERDELSLAFSNQGGRFVAARIALLEKDLAPEERVLLKTQGEFTQKAVPLQNRVVELLINENTAAAITILANDAIPLQDNVLDILSKLLTYQTNEARDAVIQTREAYERGRLAMVFMAFVAVSVSIVLSLLLRRVTKERSDYLDQTVAANHAKSAFLAKMSHEIRTPLSAIIGFAQASLDSGQNMQERIRALKIIHQSGSHLLRIINDILDLSKIEAEKLLVEKIETSLFSLLNDVRVLAQMQAEHKGIAFNVNLAFPLPKTVITDPLRLKQIIINLVSNAIKFTAHGFVYIYVSYLRETKQLVIEVADSGIGLTQDEIKNLFRDFQQADAGINRQYGGTGLGLSLSKKLATMLNGDITVLSEKGVGSRFSLVLNDCDASNDLVHTAQEALDIQNAVSSLENATVKQLSGRVLLAEDTQEIAELVALLLRKSGLTVTNADNGMQALEKLEKNTYDLILMDIQMPIVDGLMALKQLRELGIKTPVVALTANAMKDDQEKYRAAGFDDFVAKPIDPTRLRQILEKYLAARTTENVTMLTPLLPVLSDSDPAYLQIVDSFIAKLPDMKSALATAMQKSDWKQAQEVVHKLKGMGTAMGFPPISDIAAGMMFQFKSENFTEATRLHRELDHTIDCILAGRNKTA